MAGPGLREAKRAEMERRLALIAHTLVLERGLGAVTVDDIVAEANVSRRTFSNYYTCKEEAVAAVLLHTAADGLADWEPPTDPDGGIVEMLRELVRHQFDAGVLTRFTTLAGLAAAHPQLTPYFHEAQWRLWAMAGERALRAGAPTDPLHQVDLFAALGAIFGVISSQVPQAGIDAAGTELRPELLRHLIEHVLTRLETGLRPT